MQHHSEKNFANVPYPWRQDDFVRELGAEALGLIPVFDGDTQEFLALLTDAAATSRLRPGSHLTTSCVVLSPNLDAALLVYHRKYQQWVYPGGHPDEDWLWLRSALRECREETSIDKVEIVEPKSAKTWAKRKELFCEGVKKSLCLPHFAQRFNVPASAKLAAHTHFDLVFCFRSLTKEVRFEESESEDIRWWAIEDVRAMANSGKSTKVDGDTQTAQIILRCFDAAIDR